MFNLNLNKSDRNALMAIAVLMTLIFVLSLMTVKTANYQPRPITITPVSEESLFGLKPTLSVPLVQARRTALTRLVLPQVVFVVPKNL